MFRNADKYNFRNADKYTKCWQFCFFEMLASPIFPNAGNHIFFRNTGNPILQNADNNDFKMMAVIISRNADNHDVWKC